MDGHGRMYPLANLAMENPNLSFGNPKGKQLQMVGRGYSPTIGHYDYSYHPNSTNRGEATNKLGMSKAIGPPMSPRMIKVHNIRKATSYH